MLSKKRILKGLFFNLFVACVFLYICPAWGFSLYDTWATFEEGISHWDPIGKALDPLEEAVPGLFIKGFIRNRTYRQLHSPTNNIGLGNWSKKWKYDQILWEAKLEGRYRISESTELVVINKFQYDAMFDWDDDSDIYRSARHETHYYHRFKDIMRECFLDIQYPSWNLKLGKQQVVWGKMEGKFTDVVNPMYNKTSAFLGGSEYIWYGIGLWMANYTKYWANDYIQILWIPDFEEARGPYESTAWWYPALRMPPDSMFTSTDKPDDWDLNDSEFGFKFDHITKNNWDIALIYFYTWSDSATNFKRFTTNPDTGAPQFLYVEPKHTRIHQFGIAMDKVFWAFGRDWTFRFEGIYTANGYVSTKDPQYMSGAVKKDVISAACAFEARWLKGALWTMFEPTVRHQCSYDNDLTFLGKKMPRDMYVWIFAINQTFYEDRLKVGGQFQYMSNDGALKSIYSVSFQFSDNVDAIIELTTFDGGSPDDYYGMYREYDNLGFMLKYQF